MDATMFFVGYVALTAVAFYGLPLTAVWWVLDGEFAMIDIARGIYAIGGVNAIIAFPIIAVALIIGFTLSDGHADALPPRQSELDDFAECDST